MKDQWKQISGLYHEALKLPESEREAFLKEHAPNEDVRLEVESLLAHEHSGEQLLKSPALEVAAKIKANENPVSMTGRTLGHYRVADLIGKGGMGEVYIAKDQKLGRDVAIKILPEEFTLDTDRVARFQREAKLLASLNHSNIAVIHGLEESGTTQFLVLELVEGETLAARLKRGSIPVEEALKLALQIAEALEAAHEKGIIHRDLKPANIKITPEGKVKVLDFGLAKAYTGDQAGVNPSDSPTISNAATRQGVILGTAAYMSPEQVRGKTVDRRADIWAFGCVLYEMLTGQAAFQGKDVTEILASVVKGGANLDLLPDSLHLRVREVITRGLQKDLRRRYQGIADASYEIEQALADSSGVLVQSGSTVQPRNKLSTMLPWVAAALVFGLIIAGVSVWYLKPSEPRQVMLSEYILPEGQQFTNTYGNLIAVSPDGRQYVYVTDEGLYLRSLDEFNAKLIPGTGTSPACPVFSPDGKWIGYFSAADSKLKKIAVTGGAPVTLCDAPLFEGGNWGTDNRIVYREYGKGIFCVSADGGNPELIVKRAWFCPQLLPDGKSLLFTFGSAPYKIGLQSLQSGEPKELFAGGSARYISTGHIVYGLENNLMAVPFDLKTLKVTGGPVTVVEGVWRVDSGMIPQYTVSDSGTLAYIPDEKTGAAVQRTLVWVDRNGNEEPLGAPLDAYYHPRVSPDGTRVALNVSADSGMAIYAWDLIHKTLTRLTFEGDNAFPLWSPDGKRLAFWSHRQEEFRIWWKSADGTGKDEPLGPPGYANTPGSWADNGKILVLTGWFGGCASGIGMLSMEGDRKFKFLLNERYYESQPRISPDGRWMAYTSHKSGRDEIYVRPFPDVNEGLWQVSINGGDSPLWSPDGREIFYRNGNEVIAVSVKTSPVFIIEASRTLFQGTYVNRINSPGSLDFESWDISPDGKRFLMMKEVGSNLSEAGYPRKINIVVNWSEKLKKKVPVE